MITLLFGANLRNYGLSTIIPFYESGLIILYFINFVKTKDRYKVKQRILVTGASGFLGKAVVNKLLRQKDTEVMAVCHYAVSCRSLPKHPRLFTEAANLASAEEFEPLFAEWQPEIIFHLGALARLQAGQEEPEKAVAVNLLGSIKLLEYAARYGVKKYLFTSSDLAREAKSVVGMTKLLAENYLQLFPETKPEVVVFRMPNLYDFPGSVMDIFARQITENKDLSITDERMARRFITREEATDYLLYLLKNGQHHRVYSVKQEPIFIKDLALKMIAASGKNLNLKIIGARPGEKLYQASYSDEEAENTGFKKLALLKHSSPVPEETFSCIRKLPVPEGLKTTLENQFKNLFEND